MLDPSHGHGLEPADVPVDDRRLHAAGAVALDPAVAGEDEPVEHLAEVLDHVVAFRLAVDQHVEPDLFLDLDGLLDLPAHLGLVLLAGDRPLFERRAGLADLRRLRERSDGRRRQQRQVQILLLLGQPLVEGTLAGEHRGREPLHAGLHLRVVDALRFRDPLEELCVLLDRRLNRVPPGIQSGLENCKFLQLLHGEGEPLANLLVQLRFSLQVHRTVQQRARGRQDHAVGPQDLHGLLQRGQHVQDSAPPHVPTVDNAQRQRFVRGHASQSIRQLLGPPHQIQMNARHGQSQSQVQILPQGPEVRRQTDRQSPRGRGQVAIGVAERFLGRVVQIERKDRLIDLDRRSPRRRQTPEDRGVDGQDSIQQRQRLEVGALSLAQQQERHRPQEHRAGHDPQFLRLDEFVDRLRRSQAELLIGLQFRDDIVVVRVEPLGHLHGRDRIGPAGHGEVGVRIHRPAGVLEPARRRPQHDRRVQDVVVEREVVARDDVDAQVPLQFPIRPADRPGCVTQLHQGRLARPVRLQGLLPLAMRPHPGESEVGSPHGHDLSSQNCK